MTWSYKTSRKHAEFKRSANLLNMSSQKLKFPIKKR